MPSAQEPPPGKINDSRTATQETLSLPNLKRCKAKQGARFLHMLEVYVDDFIQLVQSSDPQVLQHGSRAVLHGVYGVFPPTNIT